MNKVSKIMAAGLMAGVVMAGTQVKAADVTVGVDVASAYVFRGITLNDGPVAQPYVDVSGIFEGLDFGVWGNVDIDDYDGAYESGQFSEIDLWVSYTLPIEAVDLSIMYTEYTYPGAGGAELVDGEAVASQGVADREARITLGLDVILAPYVSANYGLDGAIEKDLYIEAGLGYEAEIADGVTLALGAAVGYLEPDEGDSGFHQYQVSASISYGILTAGVIYYGQIDDDVLSDDDYDVEVVGTIGLAYSF